LRLHCLHHAELHCGELASPNPNQQPLLLLPSPCFCCSRHQFVQALYLIGLTSSHNHPPPPPLCPSFCCCSRHQFVQALYLIELTKRGMPVPAALPPGPFPPTAGNVSIAGMVSWWWGVLCCAWCEEASWGFHCIGFHTGWWQLLTRHSINCSCVWLASMPASLPTSGFCCTPNALVAAPHTLTPFTWFPFLASFLVPARQGAPADIYSATLVIPDMVPRQMYQPQPVGPMPFASQVCWGVPSCHPDARQPVFVCSMCCWQVPCLPPCLG